MLLQDFFGFRNRRWRLTKKYIYVNGKDVVFFATQVSTTFLLLSSNAGK